jgi:hypothetical protein
MTNAEELAPNVTREFLSDGRIVVFSLGSASREAVDIYIYYLKATGDDYPNDITYCLVHDFSKLPTITPYIRQQLDDVVKHFEGKFPAIKVAVIAQPAIYGRITSNFVQRDLDTPDGVERRVFQDQAEAITWLESLI